MNQLGAASLHTWVSKKGSTLKAQFIHYVPEYKTVTLKQKSGRRMEIQLSDLDETSQALVLKLHAEQKPGPSSSRDDSTPEKKQGKVYMHCDFSSTRWWNKWKMEAAPSNFELVKSDLGQGMETPHSGKRALRVTINKGQHNGGSLTYRFRREPEQMYFRYYLLLGKDWQYNGKMPGWGGTYGRAGWGGKPSNGKNGWSARGSGSSHGDKFRLTTYCYHADMKGSYGDNWYWNHPGLEKGRWYCVEQYCQINTPGENDGIIRGWIDGKKVFEKTNIRMRHTKTLGIENVWFNFYYGGKATAPKTCYAYLDDIVISDQYIGPSNPEGN